MRRPGNPAFFFSEPIHLDFPIFCQFQAERGSRPGLTRITVPGARAAFTPLASCVASLSGFSRRQGGVGIFDAGVKIFDGVKFNMMPKEECQKWSTLYLASRQNLTLRHVCENPMSTSPGAA